MKHDLRKAVAIASLTDPFTFIAKYWPFIVGLILAYNFLMGVYGWLDIVLHVAAGIFTACFALSGIMMCWIYAKSPDSRSPYTQMAYFFVFLCLVLTVVVSGVFIFA